MNTTLHTETREERAARFERGDIDFDENYTIHEGAEAAARGRALTDAAVDAVELAEIDRLVALGGRPSIGSRTASGVSRKRQVRIDLALDHLLIERAARDHISASEVMRHALVAYLDVRDVVADKSNA